MLKPELRRALNDRLLPLGCCVAVNWPPDELSGPAPRPQLVAVKLPRAGAGRPPRGGVFIPAGRVAGVRLERVSKHAAQKIEGPKAVHLKLASDQRKKGAATIRAKRAFLASSSLRAEIIATVRKLRRLGVEVQS